MSTNVYTEETESQPSIYRSYLRLEPPQQRTVRALVRTGIKNALYYTVFDEDAVLAAESIYSTHSVIKMSPMIAHPKDLNRKVSIQYLPLSEKTFTSLLKTLIFDRNYKVEIYNAENEKKGWKLQCSGSPGHLEEIEDLLYSSTDETNEDPDSLNGNSNMDIASTSIIAAIKMVSNTKEGKKVGLAYYNPNSKFLGLSEFPDTDLFSNTESILIQLGVKECLIGSTNPSSATGQDLDFSRLTQTINRCDILITPTSPSSFNSSNSDQDLVTLSGNEHILSTSELASLKTSLASSNALITYLSLLSNDSVRGCLKIGKYDLDQYMRLDSAAVKALNLFPPLGSLANNNANNSVSSAPTSIYALLNQCKTNGGSRLLSQWLKQPLVDINEIHNRHSLVGWFVDNHSLIGDIRGQFLVHVPDISRIVRKLISKRGYGLDEVVRLYQLVKKLDDCIKILEGAIAENDNEDLVCLVDKYWLADLKEFNSSLRKFADMIEQTIDLESLENATSISSMSSLIQINPQYDERLMELQLQRESVEEEMKQLHEEASLDLGMEIDKKLKMEKNVNHGWCFRLTRNDSSVLRGKSSTSKSKNSDQPYQELQTVKAGVFFTTMELSNLSIQFNKIMDDYAKQQSNIVQEIRSIAATYIPVFTDLANVLDTLDVISSFASVASTAPIEFVRPSKLYSLDDPARKMRIWQGRHPCLEVTEGVSFIPNDYVIGGSDDVNNSGKIVSPNGDAWEASKDFYLITGPNMGGKSTYIRTLGVICLMNQIGSFIPCLAGSELAIVDAIHARVGASDSQLKGVSTFMAEMLEMSSIIASAHSGSLVIVDELGRGTSTYDGFGLAWAISEHLAKDVKSWTLFATHFHELTALANEYGNVGNLHVVAHVEEKKDGETEPANHREEDNVTLLYKVEPGISDQSFGIHVAELVKFPQKIISMAKRKARELEESEVEPESNKRQYTKEEYSKGKEDIKKILKEWKSQVIAAGGLDALTSEKALDILRSLTNEAEPSDILKETFSL